MPVDPIPQLDIRDRGIFAERATLEAILPKLDWARRILAGAQANVAWLEGLRDRLAPPAAALRSPT